MMEYLSDEYVEEPRGLDKFVEALKEIQFDADLIVSENVADKLTERDRASSEEEDE